MPFFNPGTVGECVEVEDHNKTIFFFELEKGFHLEIGTVFDDSFEVVSLHPLKVVEHY